MYDRCFSLSLTKAVAIVSAAIGTALVVLNARGPANNDHIGFMSVPFLAFAVVMWVRSYFVDLSETWSNAFEIGRDLGRQEAEIRHLR